MIASQLSRYTGDPLSGRQLSLSKPGL